MKRFGQPSTYVPVIVLATAMSTEAALAGFPTPLPLAGAGLPGLLLAGAVYGVYRICTRSRD